MYLLRVYAGLLCFALLQLPVASKLSLFPNIRFSLLENRLNSASLLNDAATSVGVSSPWNAPAFVWKLAWLLHSKTLPILHYFDKCAPNDTFVNLSVLWWKAISGNRRYNKLLYDKGVAYDLLPSFTRFIVAFPLCYLYPNLHHANVAIRTVFLDNRLNEELSQLDNDNNVMVVVLGGGFDTRALRYLNQRYRNFNSIDFYEIDLPEVVQQKKNMLDRFVKRRGSDARVPKLLPANLNDIDSLKQQLKTIYSSVSELNRPTRFIFMAEAVLMYLQPEKSMLVLKSCKESCLEHYQNHGMNQPVSFILADRLPLNSMKIDDANPQLEKTAVQQQLRTLGLNILNLQLKPGRARHMVHAVVK